MDPNSYQAYIAGQAGPDSPYRFGFTPSKHVQHMAKIAPTGRFGGAARAAASPSKATISPYHKPYTATTPPVASPSIGADIRAGTPDPATTGPVAGPSPEAITRPKIPPSMAAGPATTPANEPKTRPVTPALTTAGPAASPSIAPEARPITPTLSTGNDSIPSSPSHCPSRSPSPDAAELISSLVKYESLSDDALYDATLNAQQAMVKWQNEYMALETEISRLRGSPYNRKTPKANPRKLEDPDEYDRKHHDFLQQLTPQITRTAGNNPRNTARPHATKPINKPPFKGRGPRNELHIDMNEPMQPVEGKRIRKPRVIDNDNAAVLAPKNPTKRPREYDDNDVKAPVLDQPAAKKHDRRARSITPPDWVRTARNVKLETQEPSAVPENGAKRQEGAAKAASKSAVEKEPVGEEKGKGKDAVRAAAARATWARRRADGTNGRYGGKPKGGRGG